MAKAKKNESTSTLTKDEILAKLSAGEMTTEEASAALDKLEKPAQKELYCKIAQKGGVSVYGLGRWPTTLYGGQWIRLLAGAPKDHFVLAFIEANRDKLEWKDEE